MARPTIGITTSYNDPRTAYSNPFYYADSVERAGGLPILLPYRTDPALAASYVDRLQGILFSGGDDLDPAAYGETWHEMAERIDPLRERFERALITEVERRRVPALGICLGSQLMNVHRGGSLVQFIPDLSSQPSIEHRNLDRAWNGRHNVRLLSDSLYARALGRAEIEVNTSHKQSIRAAGRGLRVIATAPDGIIEGVEDPSLPFFVGVQWHAERLSDQPEHFKLFEMLVGAAVR
jgi:putative glutamine amidotransferase